jgi:hypothetical protein
LKGSEEVSEVSEVAHEERPDESVKSPMTRSKATMNGKEFIEDLSHI